MEFDLEVIKRVIAEKYGWGKPSDWTNFHFKELSKAIETSTGDRLSEETLKRIFGKRKVNTENYNPQTFSQLALIKFVESLIITEQSVVKGIHNKSFIHRHIEQKLLFLIIASVVLILVILIGNHFRRVEKYQFRCENPRDVFPFTATFKYDISEIKDSVFSDFGNMKETYLPPGKAMINYFYSNPGDYHVRFYTRSRMLDSLRVIAWSRDWQAGAFPNDKPELFQAFNNQTFYRQPNCFYATEEGLKTEGIDLSLKNWTAYQYFFPFQKSLDRLVLETRILNNASTGSLTCYDIEIKLLGDSGTVDFKFTQPKCSRYASLRVSEKFLDGKYNDLSPFTVDMSDWLRIRMNTGNKNCNIYMNEKLVFTQKYERQMGELLGVVFQFYGSGKIDYLYLKDSSGKSFYLNDFEEK